MLHDNKSPFNTIPDKQQSPAHHRPPVPRAAPANLQPALQAHPARRANGADENDYKQATDRRIRTGSFQVWLGERGSRTIRVTIVAYTRKGLPRAGLSSASNTNELRPIHHQFPPLHEQVSSPVCSLHLVFDRVGKRHLGQLTRVARGFCGRIAER